METSNETGGMLGSGLAVLVNLFTSHTEGFVLIGQSIILGAAGALAGYYMNALLKRIHKNKPTGK